MTADQASLPAVTLRQAEALVGLEHVPGRFDCMHLAVLAQQVLFSRVVPTVKDIGLWGPRVQKAFAEMGVMDYAKIDVAEVLANDGKVADDFDRKMFVEKSIAAE